MALLVLLTLIAVCSSAVVRQAIPPGSVGRLGTCAIQIHCAAGLTCVHGECLQLVREGDSCGATWQTCGSTATIQCLGVSGDRRCRTLVPLGGACGTPWRICPSPLACHGIGIAASCYEVLPAGARCDRPFRTCGEKHSCRLGALGVMQCVPNPMPSPSALAREPEASPDLEVGPTWMPAPSADIEASPGLEVETTMSPMASAEVEASPEHDMEPTMTPMASAEVEASPWLQVGLAMMPTSEYYTPESSAMSEVSVTPEPSAMPEPSAASELYTMPEPSSDVQGYMEASAAPTMLSEPSESAFASLPPMPSWSCQPCPPCMVRAASGCECIQSTAVGCKM